jgi:hypothetical protein
VNKTGHILDDVLPDHAQKSFAWSLCVKVQMDTIGGCAPASGFNQTILQWEHINNFVR